MNKDLINDVNVSNDSLKSKIFSWTNNYSFFVKVVLLVFNFKIPIFFNTFFNCYFTIDTVKRKIDGK